MSTRRSGRATKAVKYTSASEGSDFEDKKKRTRKTQKAAQTPNNATPKKAAKRAAASDDENDATATTTTPKPKRQKKDASILAAEAQEKQAKADKAAHKKLWQDWLASHDVEGEILEVEPDKEESITQTDALKKYGLKKEELTSLLRFEKKNPLYGGTMKLFLEEDVRELGFRKLGILEGYQGDDDEVVRKGEEVWGEEHKDDLEPVSEEKQTKPDTKYKATPSKETKKDEAVKPEKPKKEKTPKQKWTTYISTHSIEDNDKLAEEPSDVINQTESKNKYGLTPQDLACLSFFPKKNPMYGKIMKLFKESEVKMLAYRKIAVLAGVEDNGKDDEGLLEKGKALFEEQQEDEEEED